MARTISYRRSFSGTIFLVLVILALVFALRHNENHSLENRLAGFGGECRFSAPLAGLKEWLPAADTSPAWKKAHHSLDLAFGRLVTLDVGRATDATAENPRKFIATLLEAKHVEVIMIEGLPLTDDGLMQLAALPELRELGLSKTKVTPEGLAKFKDARPNVEAVLIEPAPPPEPSPTPPAP